MNYKKIGVGLACAGIVAATAFVALKKPPEAVEAIVVCPGDEPITTEHGAFNPRGYVLGEVLRETSEGWQRYDKLDFEEQDVHRSTRTEVFSTTISGGFDVEFSGEVSEQLRSEVLKGFAADKGVKVEGYQHESVRLPGVLARLNDEAYLESLAQLVDASEPNRYIHLGVVTSIVRGDRVTADVFEASSASGGASVAGLGIDGLHASVSEECAGKLNVEAHSGELLFELTRVDYYPVTRQVKLQ